MYLEVYDHEVPLVISPVMQATGWQIVHTPRSFHLCDISGLLREVSRVRGSPRTKKSELRAHQMLGNCGVAV